MDSHTSNISLIDLSAQFPFDIDDAIKKEICFGESLIISCGHLDGEIESESSESECEDTTVASESSHKVVEQPPVEIKDFVEERPPLDDEEDDDFHFYFFPDCNKPLPPQDSEDSLLIVDGLPKVNPAVIEKKLCTCDVDKRGKCECYANLLCKCGAKTKLECTCPKLAEVCICRDGEPMPECLCSGSDVCLCHPDGLKAVCTCDQVDKPCICHPGKYASPVCICDQVGKPCYCHAGKYVTPTCKCKHKPKAKSHDLKSIGELPGEEHTDEAAVESIAESIVESSSIEQPPCDCQKPDKPPQCFCLKGRDCVCKGGTCVCEVLNACVCEPTSSHSDISCKTGDSKSICTCTQLCKCENPDDCKCLHPPPTHCTCGDRENCKCFKSCTCDAPCTCELEPPKPEECICLDKSPKRDPRNAICTCERTKGIEMSRKMKKVRAGKEGYRWCHDVDPRHTYFDYAYGRHDKVDYKEQEKEKFKILGLHEDEVADADEVCPVHGVKAPPYEKKVRRPSIDCCSAVGGMSISVETLGEDKDKFLVQVVSQSSKEGAKAGSKLVGILDCNLHTLEENRNEHITRKEKTRERRSYLAICDHGYYNKVTRICGERHVVKRLYHDFAISRQFLLEAANVVLLRYIALRRYRGNIKTETIMIDGTICESIYACLGVSQAIVNNTPLFVVKVERHIIEPSGLIHQTLTVLTLRGYTVSHEWANNCYICHLNPLLTIIPEKDQIETHAPLRETWREDLQLLSDYLNFKSCRSSEGARYVAENGALTGIIRDYLQAILLIRPHDTLHFTRHYFGSALSALDLPHDEYFDPASRHVRYFFFEQ